MKFTIHGFSQQKAIDLGLSNDDLLILRWFVDFKETGKMDKFYEQKENVFYYWVAYKKIIEDLPIITSTSKSYDVEAHKKKLQRIFSGNLSKILKRKIKKNATGTYLYIAIIEETYTTLVDDRYTQPTGQKCPYPMDKNVQPIGQKCPNKDSSIKDSSIKDSFYKDSKKGDEINDNARSSREEYDIDKELEKYKDKYNLQLQ